MGFSATGRSVLKNAVYRESGSRAVAAATGRGCIDFPGAPATLPAALSRFKGCAVMTKRYFAGFKPGVLFPVVFLLMLGMAMPAFPGLAGWMPPVKNSVGFAELADIPGAPRPKADAEAEAREKASEPEPLPAFDGRWVLIDTRARTLAVMDGENVVERFDNISIGRGGAAADRVRGDRRTPLGTFRVRWVNPDSPFRLFFGLDYPTPEHARRGVSAGVIEAGDLQRIEKAHAAGLVPPQNTRLGGRIGIHGLGGADPTIHEAFNWTQGCIALTNAQIDRLAKWLDLGTRVVVI